MRTISLEIALKVPCSWVTGSLAAIGGSPGLRGGTRPGATASPQRGPAVLRDVHHPLGGRPFGAAHRSGCVAWYPPRVYETPTTGCQVAAAAALGWARSPVVSVDSPAGAT